ncbi:hypothetical protein CTAYLR_003039 [Chrysophaeum taylorii]|uniref:AB hydrolase-1 domain-containing protein n=1 Tax=Chrysophaeum taylorii TaxID=2483200 RepID=A0AAD7XHS8_9STRA|nr:hypothetical protein CTAYLR_003039 [Chrysophaeum taylorii]
MGLQPRVVPGADLWVQEHRVEVPLDHDDDSKEGKISVFVREVRKASRSQEELPYLLYLQGGPGFPSPRPTVPLGGWLKAAVERFRVLLLDQRGTGRSTPLQTSEVVDESIVHYRADAIVKDCEVVRQAVCGGQKLTLLGQSFGGFCVLSYVSFFPEAIERAMLTCGLAPVGVGVDDVYRATFRRMEARCAKFYARYPEDIELVRRIVRELRDSPRPTPRGGTLTARRFLQLGLLLGSGAGLESLHDLLEGAKEGITPNFVVAVERAQEAFETNPIYWVLHESIYCCAATQAQPSAWAAERVQAQLGDAWDYSTRLEPGDPPILLTGEMVYSWMGDDYAALRPLAKVAAAVAAKADWGPVYDMDVLRNSPVPTACLVSYDDIYVEREFSERVAALLGPNCRCWITNEFQHSGLRDQPVIFDRLLEMACAYLEF